jgi:hypothetical protein
MFNNKSFTSNINPPKSNLRAVDITKLVKNKFNGNIVLLLNSLSPKSNNREIPIFAKRGVFFLKKHQLKEMVFIIFILQ